MPIKRLSDLLCRIKYTFEDYLQGGMQLLGKEGVLGQVQSGTSVEDIQKDTL